MSHTTAVAQHESSHALAHLARWLMILAFAAAAGVLVWRLALHRSEPAIHYQTGRVDRGRIAAKVTATGTLSALVTVSVGSQVSGRIETLGADFGSVVTKGQVVGTIEPSLFKAAVAQARANHASAAAGVEHARTQVNLEEKQLARAQALHHEGLMSTADLDTARAALDAGRADLNAARATVEQTKAALDQAELNLHYTTIVSPIDGVVISRNVDVGQTVAATLQAPTLFTIAQDLTRMQVDTNVTEADVGKIRPEMPVTFTVDAYPGRELEGVVRQVRDNAQTLQNVVTYDAVIDVDNSARALKPGMTASVTFVYADEANALRIPTAATRFKPDASTLAAMGATPAPKVAANQRVVWVSRAGRVVPVVVDIGISDGTSTQALSGDVHEGDELVEEVTVESKK